MEGEGRRVFLFCAFLVLWAREASGDGNAAEDSVKQLYVKVMDDAYRITHNYGDLEQKIGVVEVITETENLLGKFSLRVLGLEDSDRSSVEIFVEIRQ